MSQQNTRVAKRVRSLLRANRKQEAARRIPHQGVIVDRAMVLDHRYRQEHGLPFSGRIANVKLPTKEQKLAEREARLSGPRQPRKSPSFAARRARGIMAAAFAKVMGLFARPAFACLFLSLLLLSLLLLTGCGSSHGFYDGVKEIWGVVGPDWRNYVQQDPSLGPPGVQTDARTQILRSGDVMDALLEAERARQEQQSKNPFQIGWPSTQPTR